MCNLCLKFKKFAQVSVAIFGVTLSVGGLSNSSYWTEGASYQDSAYEVSFSSGVASNQSDQLEFYFYDQPGCNGNDQQQGSPTTIGTVGVFSMTFDVNKTYNFNAFAAWEIDQDVTNNAAATESIQIQPKYNNTYNVWGGGTCSEVDCSTDNKCIASNADSTRLISNT